MKTFRKYAITLACGLLFAGLVAWSKDLFHQTVPADVFHILCDAFFVSGVLLTGSGLLVLSNNEGTFDMLIYGTRSFFDMFRREKKLKFTTFYDYRESRSEKKNGFGFLLICGLFYLAVSMVMLACYRNVC